MKAYRLREDKDLSLVIPKARVRVPFNTNEYVMTVEGIPFSLIENARFFNQYEGYLGELTETTLEEWIRQRKNEAGQWHEYDISVVEIEDSVVDGLKKIIELKDGVEEGLKKAMLARVEDKSKIQSG